MARLLALLMALGLTACTTTSVTGPSCHASSGAGSSTSATGNADGVSVGSDGQGTSEAGCTGGSIAQE